MDWIVDLVGIAWVLGCIELIASWVRSEEDQRSRDLERYNEPK